MTLVIRIDTKSKFGSVTDVIKGMTGQSTADAFRTWKGLGLRKDVKNKCVHRRLNGKGKKIWLAPVGAMIQIAWRLPVLDHDFRIKCARDICRIMEAGPGVIAEVEWVRRKTPTLAIILEDQENAFKMRTLQNQLYSSLLLK